MRVLVFLFIVIVYFGGIIELVMFGVNLKLKKLMYGVMIGGVVVGLFVGFMKMKVFIYVIFGLFSLLMWVFKIENYVVLVVVIIVIVSVVIFIVIWLIGFEDFVSEEVMK